MPESIRIQDKIVIQVKDPAEALRMLVMTNMRPFTRQDWYGFSGCETKDPMIGEVDGFTVILDGKTMNILHRDDDYGGTLFELSGDLTDG